MGGEGALPRHVAAPADLRWGQDTEGVEVLVVCLLVPWSAWAEETGDAARADLSYPLGPGDDLAIEVVGEPAMSGTFRVGMDGAVTLPYAGVIPVAGMTAEAARQAVTAHLGQTVLRRPQVNLSIARAGSREIEVSGAVARPGAYPLRGATVTVRDMILSAGGLGDLSSPRAEVHRDVAGARSIVVVDLERIYNGEPAADVTLLPGDRVYVPPAEAVYVDGQVGKPGAIAYRDGMTLMQAIAQAGSTLGTARTSAVYIVRGNEKIPVNVKKIQRGDATDLPLRPRDRIYVPQSVF